MNPALALRNNDNNGRLIGLSRYCFMLLLIGLLQSGSIQGQTDSLRHQIGIGNWPSQQSNAVFLSIDFKTGFGKRAFYGFGIEGFYTEKIAGKKSNDYFRYDIASYASLGVYYNFFRIARFRMAAQLTGFFAREKGTNKTLNNSYKFKSAREGIFIGPEFSLELRLFRFPSGAVTIFSKIHSGFGFMHRNVFNATPPFASQSDDIYTEAYGSVMVGLGYRF